MKSLTVPLITILIASIGSAVAANLPAIIPQPVKLQQQTGVFELRSGASIIADEASHAAGEQLAEGAGLDFP